jgi:formate dehydrogenase iron-sulfur subunit
VADAPGGRKFIVCNADEGDSGTYADRMLMEGDPFSLIEGMIIAGFATGATKGYVYTRSEYPQAIATFDQALAVARAAGLLGADFDIEQRVGAGAYVCGEETALLESLEGRRGQVRAKPPLPAHHGLFGCPTAVNNVLTLASVPVVLRDGGDAYRALGMGRSRGTMAVQLAGNVRFGGLFEVGFGITLGDLVNDIGGGTRACMRDVAEAAAAQARTAGIRVSVIPSRSVVQSLAAVAVHEPHKLFGDDVVAMTRAAGATHYGAVTIAARDGMTSAGICRVGDVLGLVDGDIAVIGTDVAAVSNDVIDLLTGPTSELITLVEGSECTDAVRDQVSAHLASQHRMIDVVSYSGGQPFWPLIIGVE